MKDKVKKVVGGAIAGATTLAMTATSAFANSGASPVVEAISNAGDSLKTDAVAVIGSGVGIGVIFFGAKLLWGKFKSMAK